jgi:hypothetical protein
MNAATNHYNEKQPNANDTTGRGKAPAVRPTQCHRTRLVATWRRGAEPAHENPTKVRWDDGSSGTVDDYLDHELDTRFWHRNDRGDMELHIFPHIVADVAFDPLVMDWVMRGRDVTTAALDLHDPCATDAAIEEAVFTFPTVYRIRIVRP